MGKVGDSNSSPRTQMDSLKPVILYHTNCPDGFGGAYSAWKKFGTEARYIPVQHGRPAPWEELGDISKAHIYFIDFCYPQEIMDEFIRKSGAMTVLDHHEGIRGVVENIPDHIFDNDRSGSTIAWSYFHPDTSVPAILKYVEDGDLYRFTMPESHAVLAFLYVHPFEFEMWDELRSQLDNPITFDDAIEIGRIYEKHYGIMTDKIAAAAELVDFEGHTVYLASTIRLFTSDVGNKLCRTHPPFALIASVKADGMRVSLRGDGTIDVSEIARKYGGNGHKSSAAFSLPFNAPVPWTPAAKSSDEGI